MAFKTSSVTTSDNSSKVEVNFAELNQYVVDTVDCEQPSVMNGVITGIIDLGNQKLPDAEYDVDDEDKALSIEQLTDKYQDKIDEGKITKFDLAYDSKTKTRKIKKFVPQKDQQCITYIVDFPDTLLDKSKFFGENSEPKPLRLYAGGQFMFKNEETGKKEPRIQNLIPLKVTNIAKDGESKVWSMNPKGILHQMAVAAKLIKTGESFLPQDIDKLLGQTLQFKVQIGFNEKDGNKYYFEKMSFVGAIQKKDKPFENVETFLIQMDENNDVESLKQIRKHVINTMQQATNWEGSALQSQLLESRPNSFKESSPAVVKEDDKKESDTDTNEEWD